MQTIWKWQKKRAAHGESIRIVEEDGCKEKTYYDFGSVKGSIPGGDLKETTYFHQNVEKLKTDKNIICNAKVSLKVHGR